MPTFYVPPEVSKKLMEISGGDFNHPVVDRFIHDMVDAKIRAENMLLLKRVLLATVAIVFAFLLICGFLHIVCGVPL